MGCLFMEVRSLSHRRKEGSEIQKGEGEGKERERRERGRKERERDRGRLSRRG